MKLTKIVQITCSVVTLLAVASFTAPKASAATPPDSCFAFNVGTGTITDYYENEGNNIANPACTRDVDIPSTIGGTPVIGIGFAAFSSKQLTSVTIPVGVTTIGFAAFDSNQLTSASIPNSVSSIAGTAFGRNQLTSINIPLGITTISTGAFQLNQLAGVIIPESVTSIGDLAFSSNQLTSVTIPSGVTSIGGSAFATNQLTNVTIPGSVTSIGNNAFEANQLTSLTILSGVTNIGSSSFLYNQLTTITIPSSVTSVGFAAFGLQSQWGGDLHTGNNGAPDLWSSDPAEVQEAYDAIWYARLITEDLNNPNGLDNSVVDEDRLWGEDANANGINDPLGGHLINPANVELSYVNQADANLRTAQIFTGLLNSSYLDSYYASRGPVVPIPADNQYPTLLEQQAIDDALSAYYRIGDEVTITPPAISGYITPPTQTFVLGAATNSYEYTYAQQAQTGAPSTATGTLVNTGSRLQLSFLAGSSLLVLAYITFKKFKRGYRLRV